MTSTFNRRASCAALLGAVLVGGAAVHAQGGPDEVLKKLEAADTVAKQKIEIELREAFAAIDRQAATSPIRALAMLKQKRDQILSELSINEATRRSILARIDDKTRAVEIASRGGPKPATLDKEPTPEKLAAMAAEKKRAEALAAERADLGRSIQSIDKLYKAGQIEQSKKEAEALMKRYPDNPAALAFREGIGMADRIEEAKAVYNQQKEGYLLAMRQVDKAAIPPKDDIEFDTIRKGYFKEITEKRAVKMTAKEKALMKALDTPIEFQMRGKSFEDTLQSLSDKIGQPILIDKASLANANPPIDSNTLINVNMKGVQTRTVLRKVLHDNGLTYIIKNDTIQVMTVEKARETMITKVYYIGDLATGIGAFNGGAVNWGPIVDQFQTADNVKYIIEMIRKIDPLSWSEQGGPGSIQFHWPTNAIIVRNSAEFHSKLSGLGGR